NTPPARTSSPWIHRRRWSPTPTGITPFRRQARSKTATTKARRSLLTHTAFAGFTGLGFLGFLAPANEGSADHDEDHAGPTEGGHVFMPDIFCGEGGEDKAE